MLIGRYSDIKQEEKQAGRHRVPSPQEKKEVRDEIQDPVVNIVLVSASYIQKYIYICLYKSNILLVIYHHFPT